MDPINSLAKTIAALKAEGAAKGADASTTRRAQDGRKTRDAAGPGSGGSRLAHLAVPLRAIEPADPQRRKIALRLFVEAALLDEFGGELALAADFQSLVERVASAIEINVELSATAELALEAAQGN